MGPPFLKTPLGGKKKKVFWWLPKSLGGGLGVLLKKKIPPTFLAQKGKKKPGPRPPKYFPPHPLPPLAPG